MNSLWSLRGIIIIIGALSAIGAGIDVSGVAPRPDVEILRAMGSKTLTSATVRTAIAKCGALADVAECEARLRGTLPRILEESDASTREVILDGLREVIRQGGPPSAVAAGLLKEIQSTRGRSPQAKESEEKWFKKQAEKAEPTLTAASIRELSQPDYEARLLTYVDQRLSEDRQGRVEEGFQAYVATTCAEILRGHAMDACRELGISEIQRASLSLALMGLLQSQAQPEVVDRYLTLDRELVDRVWLKTRMGIGDERLRATLDLVHRWRESRPDRWNAWADLVSLR
ncbi:MAG: hypothetical protein L6R30_26580 [Thermoanaerobaculia bacterium]|nr:hypothetical protein [Thermoanaerobaculia bacterium]